MNRRWIALIISILFVIPIFWASVEAQAQPKGDWQYKGVSMNENDATLRHYVFEKAVAPFGPWDKIQLHRYVKETRNSNCIPKMPPADSRKVLFFNPGTWDRAIHATQDMKSQQWFFAANGYDFYSIEFRTAFIPYLDYDQFETYGYGEALAGTTDWTYAVFREDIKACVDLAKKISRARQIFMSGFSRGGFHLMAYAAKYPKDLKGLISLDGGGLYRIAENAATQKTEEQLKAAVASFKAGSLPAPSNVFLADGSGSERTRFGGLYPHSRNTVTRAPMNTVSSLQTDVDLIQSALKAEDIPAPPETLSDVLAYSFYWAWGKGRLTNVYEGYGDIETLTQYQSIMSRFWPTIQNLEGGFLAGYANCPFLDYMDNADVTAPFLYLGGEYGCPGGSCQTPGPGGPMTAATDVTIVYLPGYGHVDVLVGSKSVEEVKTVELEWMNERL